MGAWHRDTSWPQLISSSARDSRSIPVWPKCGLVHTLLLELGVGIVHLHYLHSCLSIVRGSNLIEPYLLILCKRDA